MLGNTSHSWPTMLSYPTLKLSSLHLIVCVCAYDIGKENSAEQLKELEERTSGHTLTRSSGDSNASSAFPVEIF